MQTLNQQFILRLFFLMKDRKNLCYSRNGRCMKYTCTIISKKSKTLQNKDPETSIQNKQRFQISSKINRPNIFAAKLKTTYRPYSYPNWQNVASSLTRAVVRK